MKKGNRYLVKKKDGNSIKEWLCTEVSNTAYKIKSIINSSEGYHSIFDTRAGDEFWILSTDISTTGEAMYKILEELIPQEEVLEKF